MKRYMKLIGIPFIIAVGIFLFIKFVWLKGFEFTSMTVDEYVTFYNSNSEGIIYVTEEGAEKKEEFENIIESSFASKEIEVYKLDLTSVTEEEHQKFIDANEFTDESFTIPMLLYVKSGNVVDSIEGYAPEYRVQELVEKNNIE